MYPDWINGVHHDGSALYVSNPMPTLGETITIKLRLPQSAPETGVYLRGVHDGEQYFKEMTPIKGDAANQWYSAELTIHSKVTNYRFKIMSDDGSFIYNALGVYRADVPDFNDFKLVADLNAPSWVYDSVFYQIFPERFHNGRPDLTPEAGTTFDHPPYQPFKSQRKDWNDLPIPFKVGGSVDFFGGDLPGIEEKLDYIQDLGVNALYLTPIFTSSTNHKYNINNFHEVDPHFGGDEALVSLRKALDAANMRIILDVTPNHCGHENVWFKQAQADPNSESADYFIFYNHPNVYESWLGVKVLPKLNYGSDGLRNAMYRNADSVLRYWLREPFRVDGWRLDVWNMTARHENADYWHEVGRELRDAVKDENPDAYLFGEHFFDHSGTMQGDEMDAVMNYQGFSFPLWRWLSGHDLGVWHDTPQGYADSTLLPAEAAAEQMQLYLAAVPWSMARMQFNLLGSHDTPRILNVVKKDKRLVKLAVALLMTYPGVPCVYYGDEIGMEGWSDPDQRRTMRWNEAEWDKDLRAHFKQMIQLRRTSDALINGGMQFLYAHGGLLVYQRQSENERLIIVGWRGEGQSEGLRIPVWNAGVKDNARFENVLNGKKYNVDSGIMTLGTLDVGDMLILREI